MTTQAMNPNESPPASTLASVRPNAPFSVPSRPAGHNRKQNSSSSSPSASSHDVASTASAALSPGGPVPQGYSYLTRSNSLATSTRSRPRGLQSDQTNVNRSAPSHSSQSPALQPQALPASVSADSVHSSAKPAASLQRSKTLGTFPREASSSPSRPEPETLAALVARLPPNPKQWTPSQVALYLSHVLGLTPRPIVEDVTNYVRSSHMGGRAFLRLREQDLIQEGLNTRWRGLMMDAVRKLRRSCLRGRIWGFGTEASNWSPGGDDDETLIADEDEYPADDEVPPPAKPSTTSKDTLRKMRERRRVRGMIQAFESASENGAEDDEDGFVALGHGHRLSGSGSGSGGSEARASLPPIYGPGFVKERAASFTSLSDADDDSSATTPNRPLRLQFDAKELEDWFGTMSEQEAAALASELEEDELLGYDDVDAEEESFDHLRRSASDNVAPAAVEEISGASPPPAVEVKTIAAPAMPASVQPDNTSEAGKPDEMIATLRPNAVNSRAVKASPYRASTYSPEELALLPEDNLPRFGTARRIPSGDTPAGDMSLPDALATVAGEMSAGDLARLLDGQERQHDGSPQEAAPAEPEADDDIVELPSTLSSAATDEHMRHMSIHAAAGVSPYGALGRKQSQKRRAGREAEKDNEPRTVGRERGSSLTTLLSEAFPPGAADEPEDGPKAPARTLSRASRRGVPSGLVSNPSTSLNAGAATPALLNLFGPPPPSDKAKEDAVDEGEPLDASAQPFQSSDDAAPDNDATAIAAQVIADATAEAEAAEASGTGERVALPLTTLEPTSDGKGSIKRRSMVLVDRARFESLARRMGALENQLSYVEEAGADSVSTRGGTSGKSRAILADMFRDQNLAQQEQAEVLPDKMQAASSADVVLPQPTDEGRTDTDDKTHVEAQTDGDEESGSWGFPFGAIPSYMLGLGAGIGFVVLSEVVGRAARMR